LARSLEPKQQALFVMSDAKTSTPTKVSEKMAQGKSCMKSGDYNKAADIFGEELQAA
jgi:hypothetical protein